jgi:transcriptional regulator with XRE-family HTH domain
MQKYVSIGERVAVYRRRRGMSQTQLGGLVQRSESWVSQVERGARPIERLGILTELARVLDVPVTELTGQPPRVVRDPQSQHELVAEVQLALSEFDFLAALLVGPSEQAEGASGLRELRAGVERAWTLTHGSQYTELGPLLRTLLRDGQAAVRRSDDAEAYELLCRTYQVVAAVMAKLGETELAWVAADRSVMAGERSSTPLLALVGVFRLAVGFVSGWRLDQAERAAASGALALVPQLEEGPAEAASLYGALNLMRAVAASRRGDGATAWQAIAEAERAANVVGEDRNDFDTEFGPTNVAVHGVSVAVELGETGEALRRAKAVRADGLSVERRARLLIDMARAHGQRRETAKAVAALQEAQKLTPEQVRRHPLVGELVRDMMRRNRRRPNTALMRLADSLGIV